MSTNSTTNRLAAALAYCDTLEKERQRKQAIRDQKLRERKSPYPQRKIRSKQDHVYIIKASNGYYKIGISLTPHQRFKELQRQAAVWAIELELVHIIASNNAYGLEQSFHRRFAEQRVAGEWFLLTAHDVEWLRTR